MPKRGGLEQFGDEIDDRTLREILRWRDDRALRSIVAALEAHTNRKAFFDTHAEAMVARRLRARGCDVRFEIPTPTGRTADFEVRRDGEVFFLHVKRIDTDRPAARTLRIPARLRSLEHIRRPYVVQLRWSAGATRDQMQRLVAMAGEFILRARVGDEMKAADDEDHEFGGVRIIAPAPAPQRHVQLTIGLPGGFIDAAPRMRRLMQRAYQQFMPRATNVIVICTGHADDAVDVETARLGSHIERWDAFPPRGRRVAHGRDADGFWSGRRYEESVFAGWFLVDPASSDTHGRLWVRSGFRADGPVEAVLKDIFGKPVR